MKQKLMDYLLRNSPFSRRECDNISNEICAMHYPYNLGRVQDILMKYLGGEDDYAYETTWELARGIVRVMR